MIWNDEIFFTSPKKVSSISCSGIKSAPIASAVTNKTPVMDSIASFVLFSIPQIVKIAIKRKIRPPTIGWKFKMIPRAIPGRATCESASESKVIFLKTKKEPISPLAAATRIPEPKIGKKFSAIFKILFHNDGDGKMRGLHKVLKAFPRLKFPVRHNKACLY